MWHCCSFALLLWTTAQDSPHLARVSPLGGQFGTTVDVEFVGTGLTGVSAVRFDTPDLEWVAGGSTTDEAGKSLKGRIRIAPTAALGPHRVQILTKHGPTNSRLFNVHQFPGVNEVEPKQAIDLKPQVIHGYLKGLADQDFFTFTAKSGERWLFDLQSIERGGFLECSLTLLDAAGREVSHNEDQDEYLETPRMSVVFPRSGEYTLKVDQYRGPQGVACGENCGYQLQISKLPVVTGMYPLGARPGSTYKVRITGEALQETTGAYLQPARGAEHYRLTFPYSMPLDGRDSVQQRVEARSVRSVSPGAVEVEFQIPGSAKPGLWRLWLITRQGIAEALTAEIDTVDTPAIDGILEHKPENRHTVQLEAGQPFHAWTLATQLGLPAIDTVLELWSSSNTLLAEHDDLMSGQGTVIGNPDSSLYYVPKQTETATLIVHDRTNRTGPSFAYRLHIRQEAPSFQLLFGPEEVAGTAGNDVEFEVLLIKQPGFEHAVDVSVDGHPEARGHFRADQHFGPSGDGDNINIPVVKLRLKLPAGLKPGADYPIRVVGRAGEQSVAAISTMWIGPQGGRNDTRRPLPQPSIHILEPQ